MDVIGSKTKTIAHPQVCLITLDGDVLTVIRTELSLVVYAVECSSPDADRLRPVRVIGLQEISASELPT